MIEKPTSVKARAMVFAAGLGTRLKPWTDQHPKALVPVGGMPMLERVLLRLKTAGVGEVVVNVHHLADQVEDFLRENDNFGLAVTISDESDQLLDTGGGLLKARELLAKEPTAPIILHNADILTDFPLQEMLDQHTRTGAAATLLCAHRGSTRRLWFMNKRLVGWQNVKTAETRPARFYPNGAMEGMAFGGVHIVSPAIFPFLEEYAAALGESVFSLTPFYTDLARRLDIRAYTPSMPFRWHDVGSPDKLKAAEEAFSDGVK